MEDLTHENESIIQPVKETVCSENIVSTYNNSIIIRRWLATWIDFIVLTGLFFTSRIYSWLLLSFCYYFILEGFTGYTLGKILLRIRVISPDCDLPGLKKALIRTLARVFEVNPILIGGIPAGIAVLISKKKQRVGDILANTFVVKTKDITKISISKGKKAAVITLCIILLLTFIYGIYKMIDSPAEMDTGSKGEKIFVSKNNKYQLTFPKDWNDTYYLLGKDNNSDLYVSKLLSNIHYMGFSEDKKDLPEEFTFEQYTQFARDSTKEIIEGPTESGTVNVTINNYLATQFELYGKLEGEDVAMLVTVIETPSSFYKFMSWDGGSKTFKSKELFLTIARSFTERTL